MNKLELLNGYSIPCIGMGTVKVNNLYEIIRSGIKIGYEMIDTAINYGNERNIGEIIKNDRDKVFLISKIQISCNGYEETLKAVKKSLIRLQTNYLDLMLIHQPYGDIFGEWRALEKLYKEGKIKSIGVSNFSAARLMDLCIHSEVKPMVDQVELHPYFQQKELVEFCKKEGIIVQAWSPLGQGKIKFEEDIVLKTIAQRHNKTVQEVILRWNIQNKIIPLPRTSSILHLKDNFNIFDFELRNEEMKEIEELDKNNTYYQDHNNSNTVKLLSVLVQNKDEKKDINIEKEYLDYVFGKRKK